MFIAVAGILATLQLQGKLKSVVMLLLLLPHAPQVCNDVLPLLLQAAAAPVGGPGSTQVSVNRDWLLNLMWLLLGVGVRVASRCKHVHALCCGACVQWPHGVDFGFH